MKTSGNWIIKRWDNKKIRSLLSIHSGGVRICDFERAYNMGNGREEIAQANAEYIVNAVNNHESLLNALTNIVSSWDKGLRGDREVLKQTEEYGGIKWWSPASSLIDSEFIYEARKAIENAKK